MNRIAGRAWITILFILILLVGFTVFLCEYAAKSREWVVFAGSPHVYNGTNIDCGVVTDREGYLLLDMRNGRDYSNEAVIRRSTVHWVGDRYGNVNAPALSYYSSQIVGYDALNGLYNYGDKVGLTELTLSVSVQMTAIEALGNYKGTVAVYNYKTGEIVCAVSTPNFDPDNVPDLSLDTENAYEGVYINRFTQSLYTPGSIFKIVTLAAALETVPDIENQTFLCEGSCVIGADTVTCEVAHGLQSLKAAFCNSCNCAFAQIALQVGGDTLERYVDQFGVVDGLTFDGIQTAMGSYSVSDAADVNVAWSAVGQYEDLVNPAAFLRFVGAIANGGRGANPYVVEKVSVGNETTYKSSTDLSKQIMSANTVATLTEYMAYCVSEKYGADNFAGLDVCAKTGTAEVGDEKKPNAMFTGFVQNEEYPLAFIICIEDAGYGKTVCVPIASSVLSACKKLYDNS